MVADLLMDLQVKLEDLVEIGHLLGEIQVILEMVVLEEEQLLDLDIL